MISYEKLTVTIAWDPSGLHVIEILPKGQKFNANNRCASLFTKLSKLTSQGERRILADIRAWFELNDKASCN
jgi:hypothetical protein